MVIHMKKMKELFHKQTATGIALLGMVMLLVLYVFVYMEYMQRTQTLEMSNAQLENSLIKLKEYYDNMEQYEQDSQEMQKDIVERLSEYPADTREEDVIMLAVKIQKVNSLNYENINLMEQELVYSVPQNTVMAAAIEGYEKQIDFKEKKATYVNHTNYGNLKGIIEQIYADPNRIAINHISYAKEHEDSEVLSGIIDVSFYSAAGTDKEYVAPDIAEYRSGTENIFQ